MFQTITGGSELVIPSGVHYLKEPVRLSGSHIRIRGEEGAVLRGTLPLKREDFREEGDGVFSASLPCAADAFYIGSRKYTMARYPKADRPGDVFAGYSPDCTEPAKVCQWADPTGGYIHAMHKHDWGGYTYRIDGKHPDGTLMLSGGWQNNRQMGMHDQYRFAENIREEMTLPGEWYFDSKALRLYVRPLPGDDLDRAEAAVSRGFFLLENCRDVTIENLTFERSVRTFMDTKEPLLRSDWTIYRGGAVLVKDSRDVTIDRCTFRDVGSNGVFVDGNNENIRISRSHFSHIGASGLCFVGRADSVRSPLFEYNETQPFHALDLTRGPKSPNYPKNCSVEDCLIEYVGLTEKQATGVEISMACGITVKDCTVCHTSRSGINISEGTFGGHRIEGCDVFDTVRETGDHGSFNSWGRDRYWHVPDLDDREAGNYALLDMLSPNTITRSRFRCDRGWDIDLDDGSSDYIITENLCLNGGIKLREGFFRTVRNNIMVNNGLHFHAWYPESGDVAEYNIVFTTYAPYAMPEVWGRRIDGNYLHAPGQTAPIPAAALMEISRQDAASVCLDAGFTDPGAFNYIPTNPEVRGFEDFPTEFGVRYEPLRRIADTPELPHGKMPQPHTVSAGCQRLSMTVKNIDNDDEMSVYATAGHNGVLILSLEPDSDALARGLQVSDVIVAWGSKPIDCTDDLEGCVLSSAQSISVIRKQVTITL